MSDADPIAFQKQSIFQNALEMHQRGQLAEAERLYREILKFDADDFDAAHLLGVIFVQRGQFVDGESLIGRALEIDPNEPNALNNRGIALAELGRFEEAIASYDKAIAHKPDYAEAFGGRGKALRALQRYDEAIASYDRAISLKPDYAEAFSNRGNAFQELKRLDEALANYDRAIALKPDYAEAFSNQGACLEKLKRFDEAAARYDKAISLKPDYAEAWVGRGNVLHRLQRYADAERAYAQSLRIEPERAFMKGIVLHHRMLSCAWDGVNELIAEIEGDIASGKRSAEPFGWQALAKSPQSLQRCAEQFNAAKYPPKTKDVPRRVESNRIRVGYASGEFREQATSHLIVGVLEQHDKSRFEIIGFDNGWNDKSEIRRRIEAAVPKIFDIRRLTDEAAASAIRDQQIDILVNLNGYFGEERTGVFAERPAPIQVNYLGFPGTLGAPYVDYIIADRCVIPSGHEDFYMEKVVYLPDSYQANDDQREIAAQMFSRAEFGLPQHSFVYCCFNNGYKITPEVFVRWMSILKKVPGSVLWLIEDDARAVSNLRREASTRGVNPDRLVFARRMPPSYHLARHRLADLFLDTLPYNAHTTASDALWAGLPVLTQIGGTFPGRVAASLLQAIGLPELITSTEEDYQQLAIGLACNPEKLAAIKLKLANNRLVKPLFDTRLLTRHIEAAYEEMYKQLHLGLPPDHIFIAADRNLQEGPR